MKKNPHEAYEIGFAIGVITTLLIVGATLWVTAGNWSLFMATIAATGLTVVMGEA